MRITQMLELSKRETLDEAVAKLIELAEYPKLLRWIQFPTALVVFLAHGDSLDSGAVYVYDRKRCVWLWVDFDDQNYGGYSPSEIELVLKQCHFLRAVASPGLIRFPTQWLVKTGQRLEALGKQPLLGRAESLLLHTIFSTLPRSGASGWPSTPTTKMPSMTSSSSATT